MGEFWFTPWMWFILALLLLFLELFAPGVVFLWIAIAAGATGLLTLEIPVVAPEVQGIVFAALALLASWAGRRYFRPDRKDEDSGLNRGALVHVGRRVVVIGGIRNGAGKVKLGDSVWNALGDDAEADEVVEITGVEGTAFLVRKLGKGAVSGTGGDIGEASE